MKTVWIVLAVLVGLAIAKRLLAFILLRFFGRWIGKAIGQAALAQQPDQIHLDPTNADTWTDVRAAYDLAAPLRSRGFRDAGTFRIQEMNGVLVQLLAHPDESFYAAVYEHPQVGHWIDLAARYTNGNSITFTSSKPTGLDPRPGHPVVNAPGTSPGDLWERARRERPSGTLRSAQTETAARDFEDAYEESIAWRKTRGISACEVAKVATREAA